MENKNSYDVLRLNSLHLSQSSKLIIISILYAQFLFADGESW